MSADTDRLSRFAESECPKPRSAAISVRTDDSFLPISLPLILGRLCARRSAPSPCRTSSTGPRACPRPAPVIPLPGPATNGRFHARTRRSLARSPPFPPITHRPELVSCPPAPFYHASLAAKPSNISLGTAHSTASALMLTRGARSGRQDPAAGAAAHRQRAHGPERAGGREHHGRPRRRHGPHQHSRHCCLIPHHLPSNPSPPPLASRPPTPTTPAKEPCRAPSPSPSPALAGRLPAVTAGGDSGRELRRWRSGLRLACYIYFSTLPSIWSYPPETHGTVKLIRRRPVRRCRGRSAGAGAGVRRCVFAGCKDMSTKGLACARAAVCLRPWPCTGQLRRTRCVSLTFRRRRNEGGQWVRTARRGRDKSDPTLPPSVPLRGEMRGVARLGQCVGDGECTAW
jgi:hypothetical protein